MNNIKKNIDRVVPIKGLFKQSGYFLNKLLHDIVDNIGQTNGQISEISEQISNIKTFTEVWESVFENTSDKSIYKDTIVFIVDDNNESKIKKIWVNDKFYDWNTDIIEIYDNGNNYDITLYPNTYYKLDNQIDKITITLDQLSGTTLNKYYLEFFGNSPTVIFNNSIVFDKDTIPNFNYSCSENGICKYLLEFNNNVCNVKYLKYVNEWYELTYYVSDYRYQTIKLINSNGGSDTTFKINE